MRFARSFKSSKNGWKRPHGHRHGKKPGDHGCFIANSLKKICRFIDFGRNQKFVVRWTNWRTKTTRTTSLQMKFECIETIDGSVRILLVPTRCPCGIELISKKHCLPCDTSRTKRIKLIAKIGKALLHLGGTGKIPGGILHLSITATMDPALIDRGNLIDGDWANYSGNDSQHEFDEELQ